jgi:hypothetical protein
VARRLVGSCVEAVVADPLGAIAGDYSSVVDAAAQVNLQLGS